MSAETSTIRVDIVSDVVCPWCVIGYYQLIAASRETDILLDIHWHPFALNPHITPDGENLREHLAAKYGTTLEDSIEARARITRTGAKLGFTFNYADDMRTWNTFRAHQLIDWAEDQGKAHDAKLALFEAFFTRHKNISDTQILADVAAEIGLDRDAALAMLETGEKADSVRRKEQFWASRGVQGVPAMVFERRHLVTGAQGEASYARLLKQLKATQAA
jgi:predicted DsbA family dithiol-disulfide isomerase